VVGPDVTIIIITAYDWVSIEREAIAAGVNLCISKPMFKSTLISAFSKTTGGAERERVERAEQDFDFAGKRILLAEDHPLNAEIAMKLLARKHCEIELAENGLKALERFTTTPVGYYNAILMDVRMPIMDGLQATTNIRHWDKDDAKTIPIIAMTANAFDEDVEHSKAAGMDAHLAKPIDPQLLYRVLHRLMN
ncbi:MAG: response regulator, partial [Eubacteriales bacterium]|nr:response regulator [Eubacteriales bacterium]